MKIGMSVKLCRAVILAGTAASRKSTSIKAVNISTRTKMNHKTGKTSGLTRQGYGFARHLEL
jgi:hypothetical protein